LQWAQLISKAVPSESSPPVTASLVAAIHEDLNRFTVVPLDVRTQLPIGVGPPFPEFLKLTLVSETCLMPRLVGSATLHFKVERLHNFSDAIELKFEGLPEGLTATASTIDKGRNELSLEIRGGENLPQGEIPFQINSQVFLQGQPQDVVIPAVLKVIPPLQVSLHLAGPIPLEGKQKLTIKVERFGKENHPVQIKLMNLPEGVTAPPEIVVPAGVSSFDVELTAALTAKVGEVKNVQAQATTKFADQEVKANSAETALAIVDGKGANDGTP
jgi:hypothetical protein